jgi:predicted PurR-regulated permease PerM
MPPQFGDSRFTPQFGGVSNGTANTVLVTAIVVITLYVARDVLVPLALAILLAFILAPLVRRLRRWDVPRVVSVVLVVLAAFSTIIAAAALITQQIGQLAQDLPRYEYVVRGKISAARDAALSAGPLGRMTETFRDLQKELEKPPADGQQGQAPAAGAEKPAPPMPVEVREPPPKPFDNVQRILTALFGPVATTGIVVILVFFILLQREDLRDRVIRLLGARDLQRTTTAMTDAAGRLSTYLLTFTLLNAAFGILIAAALWLIGIPAPMLWGTLAFLMRFVPFIGGIVSGIGPVLLAAAVDPGWSTLVSVLALFIVAETAMAQVIEPMVQGRNIGLSPVAILVATAFWSLLWGPIGFVLAIPLTVCLVVLGEHVEGMKVLHVLLGDQPVLSPVESFYQRALAGDADEAGEQAETLLEEHSLLTYYDGVVLEGLRLAQADADRGALDSMQMETIRATVAHMLDDLSPYDDETPKDEEPEDDEAAAAGKRETADERKPEPEAKAKPKSRRHKSAEHALVDIPDLPVLTLEDLKPEWRPTAEDGAPVLCVAGKDALDEATAMILAQLLTKHGVPTQVIANADIAPANIGAIKAAGVRLVCVCSLSRTYGTSQTPAHLRFLVRRLRRAWRQVKIVGAYWSLTPEPPETAQRTAIQLDASVATLAAAVQAVLMEARQDGEAGIAGKDEAAKPVLTRSA